MLTLLCHGLTEEKKLCFFSQTVTQKGQHTLDSHQLCEVEELRTKYIVESKLI